jgi:hypothetical protein
MAANRPRVPARTAGHPLPGGIKMSQTGYLHIQAERCFRLANGPAGPRLAAELEALGRTFGREARELEVANGRQLAGSHATPVADTA